MVSLHFKREVFNNFLHVTQPSVIQRSNIARSSLTRHLWKLEKLNKNHKKIRVVHIYVRERKAEKKIYNRTRNLWSVVHTVFIWFRWDIQFFIPRIFNHIYRSTTTARQSRGRSAKIMLVPVRFRRPELDLVERAGTATRDISFILIIHSR